MVTDCKSALSGAGPIGVNYSNEKNLETKNKEQRLETKVGLKGALGLGFDVNVTFGLVKKQ